VLQGPSGLPTASDRIVLESKDFVHDNLSDHQLNIICGVYRIPGGEQVHKVVAV
jgi:hypothetical protein